MICHTLRIFFEALQHNGAQQVDNISISQFPPKFLFSAQRTIWAKFGQKLYNLLSHNLLELFFSFETFQHDRAQQIDKGNLGQFSPEHLIQHNCAFWAQFRPNICNLMSQAIMSHGSLSKSFEMQYNGVTQLAQSNTSQFTKKFPFGATTIEAQLGQNYTTYLMIHSLRIFLKFSCMMRHNRQTKVVLVVFPKQSSFGAIWSPS